jgi:hypothetical protein
VAQEKFRLDPFGGTGPLKQKVFTSSLLHGKASQIFQGYVLHHPEQIYEIAFSSSVGAYQYVQARIESEIF